MNSKLITTLCLTTLLTITGCASTKETSNSYTNSSEDTTKPIITLVSDSVTVEKGTNYSAKDNIKSVTDAIDGTLEYAKSDKKGSAYYLIDDSKVDTSKAGTYKVTVTATDKTGNVETKEFNVIVKDKDTTSSDTEKTKSTEKSESTNTDKKSSTTKSDETTEKNTSKKTNTSSKKATSSSSSSSTSGTQSSKAQTSNQNSSSQSTSTSTQSQSTPQQTCSQVKTKDAWDEQVIVSDAYDEQVIDQPAWDETVNTRVGDIIVCNGCYQEFNTYEEWWNHAMTYLGQGEDSHGAYHINGRYSISTVHHDATYKTVHHDAIYNTVHHDAEYQTVCN